MEWTRIIQGMVAASFVSAFAPWPAVGPSNRAESPDVHGKPDEVRSQAQLNRPGAARRNVATYEPNEGLTDEYPGQNPGHTRAYFSSRRWFTQGGETTTVDCDGTCRSNTIKLRFDPESEAHKVDIMKGGMKKGHVVARIRNLGTEPFNLLHLDPGQTGYLWFGKNPGAGFGLWFYRQELNGTVTPVARANTLRFCPVVDEGHPIPNTHSGPDPKCGPSPAPQIQERSLVPPGERKIYWHTTGLWVSCVDGCCQATDIDAF